MVFVLQNKIHLLFLPCFKTDFLALHKKHELRIQTLEDLLRELSAESKVLAVSFADFF